MAHLKFESRGRLDLATFSSTERAGCSSKNILTHLSYDVNQSKREINTKFLS